MEAPRGAMRFSVAFVFMALGLTLITVAAIAIANKVLHDIKIVSPQAHRAVYDLSLADVGTGSSVVSLNGRMVIEWRGGERCDGYTSEQRVVTRSLDDEGQSTVHDIRLNAWEASSGNKFRFDRVEFLNGVKQVHKYGVATRENRAVVLALNGEKPQALPDNVLFPGGFNLAISKAMMHGRSSFNRPLFDGAQDSATLVTAFIGRPVDQLDDMSKIKMGHMRYGLPLARMKPRHVHMSYFDLGNEMPDVLPDTPPSFEMDFSAFPNGVMSHLQLIYGDAVVNGNLISLEYFKPGSC